ncbi:MULTISPECIES: molybdate ABC transporter substrate-binding protein [Thermomonosporaceae]|uniref:molybdate ABC transporter substrate-binding protein n=1 Tax=Thermomonosporaceae TaxID=2012 RepID=UPI00255AB586|nr:MULTISPECIES: molybdate ABC transporter substrate-binding protein [Thermomonosporaceae]MDL4771479.1 molybdate ABC transporter substrate-binding protein [Actinomadura xylanilytica]
MPDSPRWFRLSACASLALLGLGAAVQGCGRPAGPVTLRVLAGSSLTEAFGEIGMAYEQEHRGVKVRSAFGGSQEMTARLAGREPADVLVTSDVPAMDGAEGYLTGPRPIVAHNSLTIAVAPGDPRRIRGLADLVRPGLRVVVGAPTVPVGRYARQIFARAGLTVQWGVEEISARAVLDRVRAGEADAGLVFITDLRSAGAAAGSVPIPAAQNVTAAYPAAAVKDGDHTEAAETFVTWLTSPAAVRLFHKYGFATPAAPPAGAPR